MSASFWLANILERVDIEIYENITCKWIIWVWEAVTKFQNVMYY